MGPQLGDQDLIGKGNTENTIQMPKKEKHFGKAHAISKNLWDWDFVDKFIQQRKRVLLPEQLTDHWKNVYGSVWKLPN